MSSSVEHGRFLAEWRAKNAPHYPQRFELERVDRRWRTLGKLAQGHTLTGQKY